MLIQIQEKANMEYSFFIFNRIYVGIHSNNYFAKTIPILIDLVFYSSSFIPKDFLQKRVVIGK